MCVYCFSLLLVYPVHTLTACIDMCLPFSLVPVLKVECKLARCFAFCFCQSEKDEKVQWQKLLYKKIGTTKLEGMSQLNQAKIVEKILSMAKVLHGLHLVRGAGQSAASIQTYNLWDS